uniref:Uncharacterized protein n=1 Tax=Janibacter limosus TaxID=53458 RepID=A0AC61U4C8_9MICO|nr:hypothetical protein [Janibacter limosus]
MYILPAAPLDATDQMSPIRAAVPIVVLLNSGFTSKTEIADILGYANHSAVSKRLAKIRVAAERFFDHG